MNLMIMDLKDMWIKDTDRAAEIFKVEDVRSSRRDDIINIRAAILTCYYNEIAHNYNHISKATGFSRAAILHHVKQHINRMDERFGVLDYKKIQNYT